MRGADGKPWLDSSGREPSLYDHLEPLAYLLKEEGRVPRRAPGGHGLEVIPSLHWARFFRFHALSRDPRRLGQSATPRFAAWLYLAEEHARQGPWRESSHTIRGSSPRIKSKPLQIKRPCTTSVVVREWSTSLGPILADQSGVRAIRFADRVIADSKGYDLRLPASLNALREASGARSSTHSVRRQRRPARNASRRASWLGG